MSNKPIFVATHPRACSTAFERVFMTRRDILQCVHEPFGDAFYYGPERLSSRYENDVKGREESGFSNSTYKTIFDRIDQENSEGKRLFIKDITHYLLPPGGKPASIAPSLCNKRKGVGTETHDSNGVTEGTNGASANVTPYPYDTPSEPGNPTVVPTEMLKKFHFTFLIRHPAYSIPSYFRCTIPPLDEMTGFYNFMPCESGYDEVRRTFDYLRSIGQVGPKVAGQDSPADSPLASPMTGGAVREPGNQEVDICVLDADDLLDNPAGILKAYCASTGIPYSDRMLNWDNEDDHQHAKDAFEKWKGFHEDAIDSRELKPRAHKKIMKSEPELMQEWTEKFGEEGAKCIMDTVHANTKDYEYLKQFALRP